MPEIISKTDKLDGFPKELYFSENMQRGQFGLASLFNDVSIADNATLTDLANIRAFASGLMVGGGNRDDAYVSVFGQDDNGMIFGCHTTDETWQEVYKPTKAAYPAGILEGPDNILYYVLDRYFGKAESWLGPQAAGTVAVTHGSANIVGTGTGFNALTDPGKRILIDGVWYTITSSSDSTHAVLTTTYAGTTASGLNYQLFRDWVDDFQDFGSTQSTSQYPWAVPFMYEGDILIPRVNKLCRLNYGDGSFDDEDAGILDLPVTQFPGPSLRYRCGSGGQTGILLGVEARTGAPSYLILWDNLSDRSIAPWLQLNSNVQALRPYGSGWIVVTEREILYTNGYSIKVLSTGIDSRLGANSFSVDPTGIEVVEDRLIIANQIGGYTRKRSGIYVYHITQDKYEYIAPLGTYSYNATPYATFLDTAQRLHCAVETVQPAKKYLTLIKETAPAQAYAITNALALTGNKEYASGVKVDLAVLEGGETITADVSVKLASMNRRLWGIQKAKVAGSVTTQITVDGTALSDAKVGEEITVMEGVNAGTIRHITAISGAGTSTEVWTLDEALGSNIEINVYINITPFRQVAKKTVTSANELRDMYFNDQNRQKGKQFLAKIAISNANVPIEILEVAVVAQDQGTRT